MTRRIRTIAIEIAKDWGPRVNYAAVPYLRAMHSLDDITDAYFADDARGVIRYFLHNAKAWRGPVAKEIKAELRAMLAA